MQIRILDFLYFPHIALFLLLTACSGQADQDHNSSELGHESMYSPEIATGFWIEEANRYRILYVNDPWDQNAVGQKFYLVDESMADTVFPDGQKLVVPLQKMVCLSATHLSFLDALGALDRLAGVSSADYVVSKEFMSRVERGKITEIGIGDHFKLEELIRLAPDAVMVSPQKGQGFELIRQTGITIIPNGDYLETHPLGRAEWIKFVGVLTGEAEKATEIFDSIKASYDSLRKLTVNVKERPTVLSGKQYGGFWNLPGGQSYIARLLSDAGADYVWKANPDRGSLSLDFETVYDRGLNADFWRFLVYSDKKFTYETLVDEDARYADFTAFKNKNVLVCNTFETPYFQKGLLEPQVILADYISIFHPDLLPGHTQKYYHLLQ